MLHHQSLVATVVNASPTVFGFPLIVVFFDDVFAILACLELLEDLGCQCIAVIYLCLSFQLHGWGVDGGSAENHVGSMRCVSFDLRVRLSGRIFLREPQKKAVFELII